MKNYSFLLWMVALIGFCPPTCRADLPTLTVLHTFAPCDVSDLTPAHHTNLDGACPEAPLLQGPDGVFYGTTSTGSIHGTGTIFKINSDGTGFTILHSFAPLPAFFTNDTNADGCYPTAALVSDKDGTLCGVTTQGGPGGSGTVFKLNADGSSFEVLHSFESKGEMFYNSGGASPQGLTLGLDSAVYGVAELGGGRTRTDLQADA